MSVDPAVIAAAITRLDSTRKEIDTMRENMSNTNNQAKILEKQCIQMMIQGNKGYIDVSPNGVGPFWALNKVENDGTLNKQRLAELYEQVIQSMWSAFQQGHKPTVGELVIFHQKFLQPFSTRRLKLELRVHRPPDATAEPLVKWLKHEES